MDPTLEQLRDLDSHHRQRCAEYGQIVGHVFGQGPFERLEDLPFIHVSAFKELDLLSVPRHEVHRTMTSSGTSGKPSTVFIDKDDSFQQVKSLGRAFAERFGQRRRQMFVVGFERGTKHDARWAAVAGFTMFGRPKAQSLEEFPLIEDDEPIIIGMTTDIWAHRNLLKSFASCRPVVLHGGGWKKLEASRVTQADFAAGLQEACPSVTAVNWFGMIEQVGTVYFDCSEGCFHEHEGATFLIRSPDTLKPSERGLLQVLSSLPRSYPGHSLLTDDVCELVTGCHCGTTTRAFRFLTRRSKAPARGCANV